MNDGISAAPASVQASALATNWVLFFSTGMVIGAVVLVLLVVSLIRFRKRPDDVELPRQFRANIPLEFAWTAIPLVIVLALFFQTYAVEAQVEHLDPHPVDHVNVTGFRWGWTFAYDSGRVVSGTYMHQPELVLPLNETVQITMNSTDVTHSFWIPAFLFKRDAIPGAPSSFDLTPTKAGSFLGECAQFCGLNHALMAFRVRVIPAATYISWAKGAKS